MTEFSGNTHPKKPVPAEGTEKKSPKVESVVTGTVIRRKKSLRKRFAETFTGDDSRGVLDYVFFDVAVPAAKDLMADVIVQGVEKKLFGEARSRTRRPSYSNGYSNMKTPYHTMSKPGYGSPDPRERERNVSRNRRAPNYDEIVLDSRMDAERVLSELIAIIEDYDTATVANLYSLLDTTGEYTDAKWGWTDLSDARVARVRDGYLLVFPRPIPVD